MKKTLLAVLGRGSMMAYPDGPWAVTKDTDVWILGAKRPEVITTGSDDDPNTVIGGGELQLAAASILHRELNPLLTVFAYGNRSPYLKERGYPSESAVMTRLFQEMMRGRFGEEPLVNVFNEDEWNTEGSSSFQEVHNLLTLGKAIGADEVVLLTIMVHMNRVLVMAAKHLNDDPVLRDMRSKLRFEVTESVLMRADPENYAERALAIFGSQAFLRNLERELNGSRAMYRGVTQTHQTTAFAPSVGK